MAEKPALIEPHLRLYGTGPYGVAVLHGGPGAPGYMAPVARVLSRDCGVIEPIQTAHTLEGQIQELRVQLSARADPRPTLVGSSWDAVLALLYAARFPAEVAKVILIGSAVFDAESSTKVKELRFQRMSPETLTRFETLQEALLSASESEQNRKFAELADLFFDSDTLDPITRDLEVMECQFKINQSVWDDFKRIRDQEGALASELRRIRAPAVIIHGDYDPHLLEGIEPCLKTYLPQVDVHLLQNCGHYPWIERQAKDGFFELLRKELIG
jgi:pimeloyl-ACP methyl ester carboxylesterase